MSVETLKDISEAVGLSEDEYIDSILYLTDNELSIFSTLPTNANIEIICKLIKKMRGYKNAINYITSGKLSGYTIKCPHCGIEYDLTLVEFNYGKLIKCLECGNKYFQNQNIIDIICKEGE